MKQETASEVLPTWGRQNLIGVVLVWPDQPDYPFGDG